MSEDKDTRFADELRELLNRASKENESDTPDFILAKYMEDCLESFNFAVNHREKWYGREKKVAPTPT